MPSSHSMNLRSLSFPWLALNGFNICNAMFLSKCNQLHSIAFSLICTPYLTFWVIPIATCFLTTCSSHIWVFYWGLFILGRILILEDVYKSKSSRVKQVWKRLQRLSFSQCTLYLKAPRSLVVLSPV